MKDRGRRGRVFPAGPADGWPFRRPPRRLPCGSPVTAQTCGRASVRRLSLRPTVKQQQGNAEVSQFLEHFPAGESIQVEHKPRGEKADQGRQSDGPGKAGPERTPRRSRRRLPGRWRSNRIPCRDRRGRGFAAMPAGKDASGSQQRPEARQSTRRRGRRSCSRRPDRPIVLS